MARSLSRCAHWLVLLSCSAWPVASQAWGPDGHQIVADIAQEHLTAQAKVEVLKLLGPGRSLADVASDADRYRERCANTGPWHYVNIPLDAAGYDPAQHCPAERGGCVLSALAREIAILRDAKQPAEERAFALRFIVHLVGDLHQPLHAADNRDRGGNDLRLRFKGANTTLHKLWDDGLLRATGRTRAGFKAQQVHGVEAAQLRELQQGGPIQWALEAGEIARRVAYGKLPPPSAVGIEVGPEYVAAATPIVDTQLLRAGARLAMVLNDALTRPGPAVSAELIREHSACGPAGKRRRKP